MSAGQAKTTLNFSFVLHNWLNVETDLSIKHFMMNKTINQFMRK